MLQPLLVDPWCLRPLVPRPTLSPISRSHRPHQTHHTRGRAQVPDLALDGGQGETRVVGQLVTGAQGGGFDRVAQPCSGSVGLHVADLGGRTTAAAQGGAHRGRCPANEGAL